MKQYANREETVVTKRVCVRMTCDLCGRKAEYPEDELFEWGGAGVARGQLSYHRTIDGEYAPEEWDLCYECASALARAFRTDALLEFLRETSETIECRLHRRAKDAGAAE